jgi:hypothetical protein
MLRLLLCAYGILFSVLCLAQDTGTSESKPSEMVLEDPARLLFDFTAVFQKNGKAMLTWKVKGELPDFFTVERSDGSDRFEVKAVLNNLSGSIFQWSDDSPLKGKNDYRIRYGFKAGELRYSKTVSYVLTGGQNLKFYPNPVDHILIVRSEQPVDVRISDGTGKPRISAQNVQGLRTLNVSDLEKGVYLLRFSNKLTNVISQEKLIKN